MPLIRVETNQQLAAPQRTVLVEQLSRVAAEVIGKPEQYVQAILVHGENLRFGGHAGPTAFVDVRSIGGLSPKVNRALAARVCALLAEAGIPGERVYLNFTDVPATSWGHDGVTFG
jgi:phenylpyruvate tautomerase PptA (4-oxalocrotonate tautomerase family)